MTAFRALNLGLNAEAFRAFGNHAALYVGAYVGTEKKSVLTR